MLRFFKISAFVFSPPAVPRPFPLPTFFPAAEPAPSFLNLDLLDFDLPPMVVIATASAPASDSRPVSGISILCLSLQSW